MRYKIENNGYIKAIGTGNIGTEISEQEYNEIMIAIQNRPSDTDTVGYRLTTDLTWETYDIEPAPPYVEEPTAEEIVEILTGEQE